MKKTLILIMLLAFPMAIAQSQNQVVTSDSGCFLDAVMKREDSLLLSWNKFSQLVVTAHETRKIQLVAAWNLENPIERKKAVKAASLKFKNALKAAKKVMASERRLVWKTFRTEVMACKKQGSVVAPGCA